MSMFRIRAIRKIWLTVDRMPCSKLKKSYTTYENQAERHHSSGDRSENRLQGMILGASSYMNIPTVDGDWMGRAYPVAWQTSLVVFQK